MLARSTSRGTLAWAARYTRGHALVSTALWIIGRARAFRGGVMHTLLRESWVQVPRAFTIGVITNDLVSAFAEVCNESTRRSSPPRARVPR